MTEFLATTSISGAVVGAAGTIFTALILATFRWGVLQVIKNMNAGVAEIKEGQVDLKADFLLLKTSVNDHAQLDDARYANHGERLSTVEGALGAIGVVIPQRRVGGPAIDPGGKP